MSAPSIANPVPATRDEFLEIRRRFVGGSDASAMYSKGYGCRRELIAEKQGIVPDYTHTAETLGFFERGTMMEDLVAQKFSKETGFSVKRMGSRVSKTHPAAGVNIDRMIHSVTREELIAATEQQYPLFASGLSVFPHTPGALECKTAMTFKFKQVLKEGLPDDYLLQLQHAMAVTGYSWGAFAVLCPDTWQFVWFPVLRDDEVCRKLLEDATELFKIVQEGSWKDAPYLPNGDRRCGRCLYRKSCRGEQYLAMNAGLSPDDAIGYEPDEALADDAAVYVEARDMEDQWCEVKEAAVARIKAKIGERTKVEVPSVGIKFRWAPQAGRKGWDSKALGSLVRKLEDEHPLIALEIQNCQKVSAPTRPFCPTIV